MTYTANHHLPQWAETDRVRMEDFNGAMGQLEKSLNAESAARNGDKAALQAQINTKANQTAVDTLSAANTANNAAVASLAAKLGSGGHTCRIAWGSYTGNGTNPKRIQFDFCPVLVIIDVPKQYQNTTYFLLRGMNYYHTPEGLDAPFSVVKWGSNYVEVYKSNAGFSLNANKEAHVYLALGYGPETT